MRKNSFVLFLLFICIFCKGADGNRVVFDDYVRFVESSKHLPMGDLIIETARFFVGKPYVASTLEKEPESLVVNLQELDCTTFVETVLALSRTVKLHEKPTYEDFCKQLTSVRYRNGRITDYTSRLHYFTDWIYENERKGFVRDITKDIGGETLPVQLSFMSSHPDKYKQLSNHPEFVKIMKQKEIEISKRPHYFIAKEKIENSEKDIDNGDIVCFVTNINGLDVSHVGFLYHDKGKLTFIHASYTSKKVIINQQSLQMYVSNIKQNKGIIVVRPIGVMK